MAIARHKKQCWKCAQEGRDNSKNNAVVYEDGGEYCFAGHGLLVKSKQTEELEEYSFEENKIEFTNEDHDNLKKITSFIGKGYRGIKDETLKYFGVRNEYNEVTGELVAIYYPTTINYEFAGYKCRKIPKQFHALGKVNNDNELFGQFRFKNSSGKYVLITGGEHDSLAAFQMLKEYQETKNYEPIVVVSPTVGETRSHKQLQNQYQWFDRFERIILCFDNDEAGKIATEKAVKVLPRGKVFVLEMNNFKDPNEFLIAKKEKEFISCFYKAKQYSPAGIIGSDKLYDALIDKSGTPKVAFPPFLSGLQKATAGGIGLKKIVNILAACVDADTEFFNGKGWKKIANYEDGDFVGQYNLDGSMTLVKPIKYIKQDCNILTRVYTKRGFDQVCSNEHRFIYWQPHKFEKPDKMKELSFSSFVNEHQTKKSGFSRGSVKTTFNYSGKGLDISEGELRLQVAVMADGRIVKEGKDNYCQMRFAKERKYKRLLELCNKFGLKYKDNGYKDSEQYLSGKAYEIIVWPKYKDKSFDEKYYSCSQEQLKIIADEILHWDGSLSTNSYSTTIKENADFVQFAYASTGIRASIFEDKRKYKYTKSCYSVNITKNNFVGVVAGGAGKGAIVEEYRTIDGFKYCFEVPSSYLIFRRNGNIFVTGNSGSGKTTIVNSMVKHWIFNSPFKVAVVSLESDAAEYAGYLLSESIGRKLSLIEDQQELKQLLLQEDVRANADSLFMKEDGSARFYLVDDRGSDFNGLREKIEELIVACDVQLIVIDPWSDALAGMTIPDQELAMAWMKQTVKAHDVSFICINHTSKGSGQGGYASRGAELSEEQMIGSSTIYKSAALNITLVRNKHEENELLRNTTRVTVTKNRDAGITGLVDELIYDSKTHRLFNKIDYMKEHPQEF